MQVVSFIFLALLVIANLHLVPQNWTHLLSAWHVLWFLFLIYILVGLLNFFFATALILRSRKTLKFRFRPVLLGFFSYFVVFLLSAVMLSITSIKIGQFTIFTTRKDQNVISLPLVDGLRDVRGQVHVHSYLSYDSDGTFEQIADAANTTGAKWIILTDHIESLPPGNYSEKVKGVIFIYGSERDWQDENGYIEDSSYFSAPLNGLGEKLHLYGHIEEFEGWEHQQNTCWDAIELVNFHSNSLMQKGKILLRILFNPRLLYKTLNTILPGNLEYWQELSRREQRPIPIFAGPDAHQNIPGILGVRADPYTLMMGMISTHIWINENEELNQETIIRAIKKGRTYIAFDYLGDPEGFQMWAEKDGKKFFTCDTVEKPHCIVFRPPAVADKEIRVFRNNQMVAKCDFQTVNTLHIDSPEPGFWRVEIWRSGFPWIISGQIMVK